MFCYCYLERTLDKLSDPSQLSLNKILKNKAKNLTNVIIKLYRMNITNVDIVFVKTFTNVMYSMKQQLFKVHLI